MSHTSQLTVQSSNIGIFEVTELSPGRWRATNTLTTFVHVTYGTEADVRAELEKQSALWEKRFSAETGPQVPMARGQRSKERWKNRTLAPITKSPFVDGAKRSVKESPANSPPSGVQETKNQRPMVDRDVRGMRA